VHAYHKTRLDRGHNIFFNFYIVTTIKRTPHYTILLLKNLKISYPTYLLNYLLRNLVDFCACIPQNPPWPRAYFFFNFYIAPTVMKTPHYTIRLIYNMNFFISHLLFERFTFKFCGFLCIHNTKPASTEGIICFFNFYIVTTIKLEDTPLHYTF